MTRLRYGEKSESVMSGEEKKTHGNRKEIEAAANFQKKKPHNREKREKKVEQGRRENESTVSRKKPHSREKR